MTARTRAGRALLVVALLSAPLRASDVSPNGDERPQAAERREPQRLAAIASSPGNPNAVLEVAPATHVLPPNLELPVQLEPSVHRLWQASPTFRRQCTRIAQAGLDVRVRVGVVPVAGRPRAATTFRAVGGRTRRATVWLDTRSALRSDTALAELLGHEFEHVVEHLDGAEYAVDSRSARPRASGRAIETERARRVGTTVALEARGLRR